jgi:hypothetical protein
VVREAPAAAYPGWAVGTAERPAPAAPQFASGPGRPGRSAGRWLLGGLVVLVVVGALAVMAGRRSDGSREGPVSPDAVGRCLRYGPTTDGGARRVEALVACDDAHDGRVLAFAPNRSRCPAGTDAVLTTPSDQAGTGAVLCIDES